jgi:intracellular septation protein A
MLLTFAGWCSFLFATYAYYDADSFFKFMVAGGIVCYYLYKGRRWARVMAMLSSVFIVLYGGFFTFLFAGQNPIAMVVSAANVVIFAASFYYLAIPETGRFFKKDAPADESDDADRNNPSTQDD